MPRTSVRLLYNKFPEIAKKLPAAALKIAEETAKEIEKTIQSGMRQAGGGRTYSRGGRLHTASSPGQMPAIDTGALAASMKYQIARGTYTIRLYTENPYALYQEYGTSKQAARPFLTPAAERSRGRFKRRMRALERFLK